MTRRGSRLAAMALLICVAAVYFSCTQTSDIITLNQRSTLYLSAQWLPTNPPGMMYELWVAGDDDTVSLGKFGYSQDPLEPGFRDEQGRPLPAGNPFVLLDDYLRFDNVFVSVESLPDQDPMSPGPIMLIDNATDPADDVVRMVFPLSDTLWEAGASFNMETPSDDDHTLNGGYGIWFSAFYWVRDSIQDTASLDSFRLVWGENANLGGDTTTTYITHLVIGDDTIGGTSGTKYLVSSPEVARLDTFRVFGLDTFLTQVVRFDSIVEFDSDSPYTVTKTAVNQTQFWFTVGRYWDWPDGIVLDRDTTESFYYERFVQFDTAWPNYGAWHWRYKGWVVSPLIDPSALGQITPPAYAINFNPYDSHYPGIEGGLLTTGAFDDIMDYDEGNPFASSSRLPRMPGEDFLTNLPPELGAWQGLVPDASGNSGTVFITLEPTNYNTDTTNFPLFLMRRPIPTTRDSVIADEQLFTMWQDSDTRKGFSFPVIYLDSFRSVRK